MNPIMSICVEIFVVCLFTRGLSLRRDVGYSVTLVSTREASCFCPQLSTNGELQNLRMPHQFCLCSTNKMLPVRAPSQPPQLISQSHSRNDEALFKVNHFRSKPLKVYRNHIKDRPQISPTGSSQSYHILTRSIKSISENLSSTLKDTIYDFKTRVSSCRHYKATL